MKTLCTVHYTRSNCVVEIALWEFVTYIRSFNFTQKIGFEIPSHSPEKYLNSTNIELVLAFASNACQRMPRFVRNNVITSF